VDFYFPYKQYLWRLPVEQYPAVQLCRDKVTKYDQVQAAVANYLELGTLSPLVGHPLYSVYALRWEGLDHQTGDPKGFLNGTGQTPGQVTENYDSVLFSPDLSNLIYKGPVSPTYFGSWRKQPILAAMGVVLQYRL